MSGFFRPSSLRPFVATGVTVAAAVLVTSSPAASAERPGRVEHARYQQINLFSDVPGAARHLDPNVVNAWGLAFGPTSPLWVSNNGSNTSTLYQGAPGSANPAAAVPLVVKIPGSGAPTGVVFNGTSRFVLSGSGKTGPAKFIFAGEDGQIFGWNPTGDPTSATLAAHTDGAVYKGLALVTVRGGQRLLAANFRANRIDVFDGRFGHRSVRGAFRSVGIPAGYAPFNVAALGRRVFVTYAKQNADRVDDVAGAGHGYVNVFTRGGHFLKRFATRGVLNSPWGLAVAPKGFGPFSGDVLVGNFGNGRIHAFSRTGALVGTLRGTDGKALVIDGLWALLPGNGTAGRTSDVWFSAGPVGESHGLVGILRLAAVSSPAP